MKIKVKKGYIAAERSEAVVAGVFEGTKKLAGAAAALDLAAGGLIAGMLKSGDFTGKLHKTAALYPDKKLPLKRIVLVGLGKEKDFTRDRLRGAASAAARAVRDLGVTSMLLPLDFAGTKLSAHDKARALVEGVMLGLYQFKEFKTKNNWQWRQAPHGMHAAGRHGCRACRRKKRRRTGRSRIAGGLPCPRPCKQAVKHGNAGASCTGGKIDCRSARHRLHGAGRAAGEKTRHGRFFLSGPRQR